MTLSLAAQRTAQPVARLGNSHGYRLDGDFAHLNAEILVDESRLVGQHWTLQLWTDEGVKVAELPLGLLQPNGSGYQQVAGTVAALPPAGEGPHILSLLLVSGFAGQPDSIEDGASYASPVSFIQPRLRGTVCSSFGTNQIAFDIAHIENPRAADNLSGTLALELWSLDAPYAGGAWTGVPVASIILGSLAGQSEWRDAHYTAHAGSLPERGHLTLMLREWTPAGYLTRDYRSLPRPSIAPVAAAPSDAASEKTAVKTVEPAAAKPAKAAPKKSGKAAAKAAPATVSVNTASVAELSAVKGISVALAAAIVAARPYAKLEELARAKGMGAKLLEKLRSHLAL